MKCPMKFGLMRFEGGEECDPKCAWLVKVYRRGENPPTVCAMTLIGNPTETPRKPMNTMEDMDELP